MKTITYLAGILGVFLAVATPGFALDSNVYLSVRNTAPVIEQADSALGLQADASATLQTSQENEDTSSSINVSRETVSTSSMGFLQKIYAWFASLGFGSSSYSDEAEGDDDIRVIHVSARSAVIVLPKALDLATVYYSTTSPVVIATSTAHVSPWRFWRRNEVAIHSLSPNTMYFYKIVGNGTTTMEASFRTRTQ